MNYYALTKYGKDYLNNRYITLGSPCIWSSQIEISNSNIATTPLSEMSLIDNHIYKCELVAVNDKLIFNFDADELTFHLSHNSLFIGFNHCYGIGITDEIENQLKRLIYLDPTNVYNGIVGSGPELVSKREKESQLQIGVNSIIIDNKFSSLIIPDVELKCDIEELSTHNQVHKVYPYYENL